MTEELFSVMKGSYLLIVELKDDMLISIGRKGRKRFDKGNYAYVGSALNGLEQRIQRHLRADKKLHWHIDYLLKNSKITDVFYKKSVYKEECDIAKSFGEHLPSIKGFGCSDCKCESHLFRGSKEAIRHIVDKLEMQRYSDAKI
jgi:Uri superfamily endonuclease